MFERTTMVAPQYQASAENSPGMKVLFLEDFIGASVNKRWEKHGLQITVKESQGKLQGQIQGSGMMCASASCGNDYKVEAQIILPSLNSCACGLVVLQTDPNSFYFFGYGYSIPDNKGLWSISKFRDGQKQVLSTVETELLTEQEKENLLLSVEVSYNKFGQTIIKGYCNGALKCEGADIGPKRGKAGIWLFNWDVISGHILADKDTLVIKSFKVTACPVVGDNFDPDSQTCWTDPQNKFVKDGGFYTLNLNTPDNIRYYSMLDFEPLKDFSIQADFKSTSLMGSEQWMGLVFTQGDNKYFFGYYGKDGESGWKYIRMNQNDEIFHPSDSSEDLKENCTYQLRIEIKQYQKAIHDPDPTKKEPGSKKSILVTGYVNGVSKYNFSLNEGENCDSNVAFQKAGILVMNSATEIDNFWIYDMPTKGWYRGDHHCHAENQVYYESLIGGDDGKQSPHEIVKTCRRDDRLDYLILTPHNQINHTKHEDDIGQNKKFEMACHTDFLSIGEGCEETTATTGLYGVEKDDCHGHMCVYFSNFEREKYKADKVSRYRWNERPDDLENHLKHGKAIDSVQEHGGFVYINHPISNSDTSKKGPLGHTYVFYYDSMNWQEWALNSRWGSSVKGLEAWRGSSSKSWSPYMKKNFWNNTAFEKWDELNCEGLKLWSLTNSDAHSGHKTGRIWTMSYLEEFTQKAVRNNMETHGNMYGTNGPLLYLSAEGEDGERIAIGSTIKGIPTTGKDITINYGAVGHFREDWALNEITIYKNGIPLQELETDGYPYNPNRQTPNGFVPNLVKIHHFELADKKTKYNSNFSLKVEPGDFVRMIVKAYDKDGEVTGFAYSNPIFVEFDSNNKILMESFSEEHRFTSKKDPNWGGSGFKIYRLKPNDGVGIDTEHANDVTRAIFLQFNEKNRNFKYYNGWEETGTENLHYYVDANFRCRDPRSGTGYFGVMARYIDEDNFIAFVCNYGTTSLSWSLLYRINGEEGSKKATNNIAQPPSKVSNLRLEVGDVQNGTKIQGYVNGLPINNDFFIIDTENILKNKGGKIGLIAQNVKIWADDIKAMMIATELPEPPAPPSGLVITT